MKSGCGLSRVGHQTTRPAGIASAWLPILTFLSAIILTSGVLAEENSLRLFADEYLRSKHQAPPFALHSQLKMVGHDPVIAFRLTNISEAPLSIRQCYLPWGRQATMRLWAVTTDGKSVPRLYGGEPYGKYVIIEPGKSLEGDLPLLGSIYSRDTLPRESDIILMWVYQIPVRGKEFEYWPAATGLVVIPSAK